MKILIADDHPIVRQGLRQILAAESDMDLVGEAKNASEMLGLARKLEWDVAIIDYTMPGRSGIELLRELKRSYPTRPILVLSMHPEDVNAVSVLRSGAAGYVNKETASEELTTAIRKAASGGRYVSHAVAELLAADLESQSEKPLHESLSDREYRVMWMIASGHAINRIAKDLSLSPNTISTYRARILKKLKLKDNASLVRYAIKFRLIE